MNIGSLPQIASDGLDYVSDTAKSGAKWVNKQYTKYSTSANQHQKDKVRGLKRVGYGALDGALAGLATAGSLHPGYALGGALIGGGLGYALHKSKLMKQIDNSPSPSAKKYLDKQLKQDKAQRRKFHLRPNEGDVLPEFLAR